MYEIPRQCLTRFTNTSGEKYSWTHRIFNSVLYSGSIWKCRWRYGLSRLICHIIKEFLFSVLKTIFCVHSPLVGLRWQFVILYTCTFTTDLDLFCGQPHEFMIRAFFVIVKNSWRQCFMRRSCLSQWIINRSEQSGVIYKANCWNCNDFYIGKTKRRPHDRKTEHFKSLAKNDNTSAIADHVKATGHQVGSFWYFSEGQNRLSL